MADDVKCVIVIDRMGWTYEEYLSQPDWLIDVLVAKWSAEAERRNRATKER